MTYAEKLLDPRWQKKRLEVFERDNFLCQSCYSGIKTLHVHHLYYIKTADPWDYPLSALKTLCVDCHKEETYASKHLDPAITALVFSEIADTFMKGCLIDVCKAGIFGNVVYRVWCILRTVDKDEILEAISSLDPFYKENQEKIGLILNSDNIEK